MDLLALLTAFAFGSCIGSFLNVCIYRIPLKLSVVAPPSSCTTCGNRIRYYDNIPIFSYLILKGRCRGCGAKISPKYPAVEFLTGIMAVVTYLNFGPAWHTLIYFVFISSLIVITFIDINYRIIPNSITLPGIPAAVLAASFILPEMTPLKSIIGLVAGGGSLYSVAMLYSILTGKEGMGFGDVKLLAMIGALTGIKGVVLTVMISSISGTFVGIGAMIFLKKRDLKFAIPFGPFLSLGAIIHIFFGEQIIDWYFKIMS